MKLLKPIILSLMILSLSGGLAHAKNNKGKVKYRGMDQKSDGMITREEWRGNNRSFDSRDWNGDGVLSGDEVGPGARRSDGEQQRAGFDQFGALDYNNDEIISRGEWHNTRRSFEGLDLNRDGKLTRDEFYNRQRYPVSVFWELDQNNDGGISRGEWRSPNDVFTRLDTNGNNLLSENEFNARQSDNLVDRIFQEIFRGL